MAETEVTENKRAFLALLRTALHGQTEELPDQVDWPDLFQFSERHHVLPLIMEAAWQNGVPEEQLKRARPSAMRTMLTQARKTAAFLALYQTLTSQRLKPLVLKGLVCRNLYPDPDKRPSGDEDLLIDPSSFSAVHEALLKFGLTCDCKEPTADLHEVTYSGPNLRIELHLTLFPADSAAYGFLNTFFEDAYQRAVSLEIDDVRIYTLSPTDHLLYLICHAYKHFLHSGVGIRQVCDIALFAEHYDFEIDWDHIRRCCERVRITRFTAALFTIASKHLGFSMPASFSRIKTDEMPMLEDIFASGIYGMDDKDRLHSATITLNAVTNQRLGKKGGGAFSSLFLPFDDMARKYPALNRYPWLLPGAWVYRATHYLTDHEEHTDPAASIRIGRQRVELLRKYGMIE